MEDKTKRKNIISNITNAIDTYNIDILGIQEALNWEKILKHINLKKYDYIHNQSGKEEMITMWNKKKFKNIQAFTSEFETGRPFLILILKNKITNKTICLINLHAGHNANTKKFIFDIINDKIKNITCDNIDRIIMLGDFNRNIYEDMNVYDYIIINNKKKFKLKTAYSSKNTCCSSVGYGYKHNYDHILDTIKPLDKNVAENEWYIKNSSDHLMVIVELV